MIYRQVIQNAQRKIAETLEYHQTCMERFDRRIDEIQTLLDDLLETGRAIDAELEYFIKQGVFDLDESGHFKNEKVEAALQEWEARTGQTIDRKDPSCYLTLLEIMQKTENRKDELERNREKNQKDYEYHKTKREEALQLKEMLNSDDPAQIERALQGINELQNDLKIETVMAVSAENPNPGNGHEILSRAEVHEQVLAQDGFAFNFPPVNIEFDKAAPGDKHKTDITGREKLGDQKRASPVAPIIRR